MKFYLHIFFPYYYPSGVYDIMCVILVEFVSSSLHNFSEYVSVSCKYKRSEQAKRAYSLYIIYH